MLKEGARSTDELKAVEIVIEELLAEFGGDRPFGIVEERGDVILESAFARRLVSTKRDRHCRSMMLRD